MEPTADTYRALARSSPWRWRTLRFARDDARGNVEAWLRRPGELLVRQRDGTEHYAHGAPYATSRSAIRRTPEGVVAVDAWDEQEQGPAFRDDGLVSDRPEGWHLTHGDPMWLDYTWTAMLDPDELSHHVEVSDVRREDRAGRETWWARLVPLPGYEPRCGCCPLLRSEISDRDEYGREPERLARVLQTDYPDAYDVALDVQTGVVVALEPVGGDVTSRFTMDIHAVDADLDEVFAGRS
jgi:hypothetical protein